MEAHNKLRSILAVTFAVILFLITGFLITGVHVIQYVEEYQNDTPDTLANMEYCYETQKTIYENYHNKAEANAVIMTRLLQDCLTSEENLSEEMLETLLNRRLDGASNIWFFKEGDSETIDQVFDESLIKQLKESVTVELSEVIYTYAEWKGFQMVVSWLKPEQKINQDCFAQADKNEILGIVDIDTDRIFLSNDDSLPGKYFDSVYGTFEKYDLIKKEKDDEDHKYRSGFIIGSNGKIYLFTENKAIIQGARFFSCLPITRVISNALHKAVPQLLLMALVYILTTAYALQLYKRRITAAEAVGRKSLIWKMDLDTRFISHLGAFLVLGVIVSVSLTLYLQSLINYSMRNTEADKNLSNASKLVESTLKNRKELEENSASYNYSALHNIALLSSYYPWLLEQEQLNSLSQTLMGENLMVLDDMGTCVVSGNGASGFVVQNTVDEMNSYYGYLYMGASSKQQWIDGDHIYFLVQRMDAPGYLCLQMNMSTFESNVEKMTLKEAMLNTKFNEADKIFLELDKPETVYVIDEDNPVCQEVNISLDDSILSGNFTGQRYLNETWYYINELKTDSVLYISGTRGRITWIWILGALMIELAAYALLMANLVFFLTLHRHEPVTKEKEEEEEDKEEGKEEGKEQSKDKEEVVTEKISLAMDQLSDKYFRKIMNRFLLFTVIMIALYALIEFKYYSGSVFRYLFSSKWERKFNLFSVTMILGCALALKLVVSLSKKVIMLISNNMGSRGVTVGHMLCSLMQFGALVGWMLYALVEFGMKISYLLTGAGVLGFVISYTCQGVFSDLLSGLFLVFEGNFQVGDWISVGEWRGQVQEIGVRATKVARGGDVRVFNNSCLSTVTIWSRTMGGALCTVSVAYETDLELALRAILDNEENYRMVCPYITAGPGVHGVTELGDSGISIRIWASVSNESYVGIAERAILQETKRLFDEKGITIPFPQVVLHQEK